jgi:AAA domain
MNKHFAPLDPKHVAAVLGGDAYGDKVLAPGPNHSRDDRSMSVLIDPTKQDGFVVNSFAGDTWEECRDYINGKLGRPPWEKVNDETSKAILEAAIAQAREKPYDFNGAKHRPAPSADAPKPYKVCDYIYHHHDGTPYHRVDRWFPKTSGFRQFRWTGSGWEPGKPKEGVIPYRLPELLASAHDTVIIVEGEKDVETLREHGFVATTNPGGAEKWTPELNQWLKGKTVYILPDNDEPGRRHAQLVARNLHGVAESVRVVALPNLRSKGGDVSDWIEDGGDPAELIDLCNTAPVWAPSDEPDEPQQECQSAIAATAFQWLDEAAIPPREFLYGQHLIRKFLSTTVAPGGLGKTILEITEALAMASGKPLLGVQPAGRLRVWLWNGEDPLEEMQRRVMAVAKHFGLTREDLEEYLFLDSGRIMPIVLAEQTRNGAVIATPVVDAVIKTIVENGIDVLSIDPFVSSHRVTENDNNAMERVAKTWGQIADITNSAVRLSHHTRKMNGGETTVEDGRGASALLSAARSARVLNNMTAEEAKKAGVEDKRGYFRVDNGKSNLAPPEATSWFKFVNVPLANGDNVGVVERWEWPNPLDDITVRDLRAAQLAVAQDGPWREEGFT